MKTLLILIYLSLPLYEGQIIHNINGQVGRVIRVEPTEVLVLHNNKRIYWIKEEIKEWKND